MTAKITNPMRDGWRTSEGLLTLAALLIPAVLSILRPDSSLAHLLSGIAGALAAAGYSVSRGIVKAKALETGTGVPEALPPPEPPPEPKHKLGSASILGWFLVVAMVASSSGCCVWNGTCRKDAAKCVTGEAAARFPHLLPVVADIAMSGGVSADIEARLAAEGITVAADVLHCIVEVIRTESAQRLVLLRSPDFKNHFSTSRYSWLNGDEASVQKMHDAAEAWLEKHGSH